MKIELIFTVRWPPGLCVCVCEYVCIAKYFINCCECAIILYQETSNKVAFKTNRLTYQLGMPFWYVYK